MKYIFPKEVIENSIEAHHFKHSRGSKIIYTIILLATVGGLISLPFISIRIQNTAQGLIRPYKERIIIQNNTNGMVIFHKLKNNLRVNKGDTLLLTNNLSITQQIKTTKITINEINIFIQDLRSLLKKGIKPTYLKSSKYKEEYILYKQELKELASLYQKIKTDYIRNKKLFGKGVIARVTLIESQLKFESSINAIKQFKQQKRTTWATTLVNSRNRLKELENNIIQLEESNMLSILKSPISGTLLNVRGIEIGSFIQTNTRLAEISPESDLIIECFVNPSKIGFINKGNRVTFQVSAYNYNQWGLASGKIIEVANDIQFVNNTPMFRVLCSLDQKYLQLKNDFKGYLKKGMIVNARFELTERTLFDLLYDKVDDWVNPTISELYKH